MIVDLSKTTNPYFVAYLKVHNIKDGEEVQFWKYSHWITGMHNAFQRLKGCPYCNGYPPEVQAEFERFILEPTLGKGGNGEGGAT